MNETQSQDAYEVVNGKHATEGVTRRICEKWCDMVVEAMHGGPLQ